MKTLKILLLAVVVILLCIFAPSSIPQMDTGMGRGIPRNHGIRVIE